VCARRLAGRRLCREDHCMSASIPSTIFSIVAGGAALALLARLAVRRIEKRDVLSGDLSA
jgi:hypothetical protein